MTMCMKRRNTARPFAAGLALVPLALTPATSTAHDEPRIGAAAPGAGNAARGIGFAPAAAGVTPGTSTPPTNGSDAILCKGDGVSGKRVEVLYVRPSHRTDRFAAMKDALGQDVIRADGQLNASAAETGGSRHWRFVPEPDPGGVAPCALRITKVDAGFVPSFSGSSSPSAWVASQSPPGGASASRGSIVNLQMQTGIIP